MRQMKITSIHTEDRGKLIYNSIRKFREPLSIPKVLLALSVV